MPITKRLWYQLLLLPKIKRNVPGQFLTGIWQLEGLWGLPLTVESEHIWKEPQIGHSFTGARNNETFAKSANTLFADGGINWSHFNTLHPSVALGAKITR